MFPEYNYSKIAVKFIKNPLESTDNVESVFLDFNPDFKVNDYISQICEIDGEVIFTINGSIIEENISLKPNDLLCFCIVPHGGGNDGKNVLKIIAMIAVVAVATYISGPYGGVATTKGFLVYSGVAVAGSYAVNALIPAQTQEIKKLDAPDIETSPNYSWGAPYNMTQEGIALPRLIGARRFAPPRIGGYRFIPPDDQTAHLIRMQFALCEDVIDELDLDDIFINGKVASSYDGIDWFYTNGDIYPVEPPIWFHDTLTEQSIDATLDDAEEVFSGVADYHNFVEGVPSSTYTLTGTITSIAVKLNFPLGLRLLEAYTAYDKDGLPYSSNHWVVNSAFRVKIEYRTVGSGTWNEEIWAPICPYQSLEALSTGWDWVGSVVGIASGTYEVRFTVTEDGGQGYDYMYVKDVIGYSSLGALSTQITNGTEITSVGISLFFPGGIYYVANNGAFENHQIDIMVWLRDYGGSDWLANQTITINEATATPFRRFVYFDDLPADQYEVQVFISGTPPTSNRYQHTVQFEYMQEGISQLFTYPGTAILCLEIPASDILYGSWPVVEVYASQLDYDAGTKAADNPAWASYYKLLEAGVGAADINLANFTTWAAFCVTNGFTVGMYLDVTMSLPALLSELGRAGSATVLQLGSKWDVIIDTVADPVQTFGSDNIIEDTFEEVFVSTGSRANTIIVWFFDSDNNNRRTPVRITDNESADTSVEPTEYTLYAVTNKDQAVKLGMTMLNSTRLTIRSMSWKSDIDAINCRVGDVVYLQNDLPSWGLAPGRVVSANTTTVTVNIAKDFDDGEWSGRSLRILIRHQTSDAQRVNVDDIEVHPIINPYNNTNVTTYTLDNDVFARVPAAGALVLIGWVTGTETSTSDEILSVRQVRIINIEQNSDLTVNVSAVDYYDDQYIDDYVVTIPEPETGLFVSNLTATVTWVISGKVNEDFIQLGWTGNAPKYYIYYCVYNGTSYGGWRYYGTTNFTSIRISNLSEGLTYKFSVSPYPTPDTSVTAIITYDPVDHGSIIDDVSNLKCSDTGDNTWVGVDLNLVWDDFTFSNFTLDYYKIEFLDISSVVLRTDTTKLPSYIYTLDMNRIDNSGTPNAVVRVRVTVVDDYGNEQATLITTFTNAAPSTVANLETSAGSTTAFTGKDVDIVWDASLDESLLVYEIAINHGGSDLRVVRTVDTTFTYTYFMNTEDGAGTPSNSVVLKVRVIDVFEQGSSYNTLTLTNPAPATPSGLSYSPWMGGIEFNWSANGESDIDHYTYRYQVESEGWGSWIDVPLPQRIFVFLDDTQYDAYPGGATIYIEVKAVDTFGTESSAADTTGVTGSLSIPVTTIDDWSDISSAFYEVPVLRDILWYNNNPSAGYIAWSTGSIWYNGVEYSISANNTALHYIYWVPGYDHLSQTDSDSSIPEGSFVIAVNNSGSYSLVWNNAVANQVIGSAWIRDAAIVNAKIANLAVTNAKINDIDAIKINTGYLSADRIQAGSLDATKITAYSITATQMATNSITAAKIYGSAFGNLTISSGSITIQTTNGITLSGSGSIRCGVGTNITLVGHGTSPGTLVLDGSTYDVVIGGNLAGTACFFSPSSDHAADLYIGNQYLFAYANRWTDINLAAYTEQNFTCGTNTDYSYFHMTYSEMGFQIVDYGGLTITLVLHNTAGSYYFAPYDSNKVVDLGTSSHAWNTAYADDFTNVADVPFLDDVIQGDKIIEIDDLSVIQNIKRSSQRSERTGFSIINDSTLPTWFVSKYKRDSFEKVPDLKKDEKLEDWEPSNNHWHWIQPGDIIKRFKAGTPEVDSEGRPYISTKTHLGLHDGAFRSIIDEQQQIHSMIEYLQTQINQLK